MKDKLLIQFMRKNKNLYNVQRVVKERKFLKKIISVLLIIVFLLFGSYWYSSPSVVDIVVIFLLSVMCLYFLAGGIFAFFGSVRDIGNNKKIVNFKMPKNKTKEEISFDLLLVLISDLTEEERNENMDEIIVYAIKNNIYDFLVEKIKSFKVNNEYIYRLMVENKLIINFFKNLDLEERLKMYFSKEFQSIINEKIAESYIFDIKNDVLVDSIQEYVDKDLSGYDNELYAIAQEVDNSKKSLYMLSKKMKKELDVDKTIESDDDGGLMSDLNKFKNESILKF